MTTTLITLLASAALGQAPGGDAAKGKSTFAMLCASCHGEKGLGNGPAAAGLNPRPLSFADPAVAARLTPEWALKITREGGAAVGKSPLMLPMGGALTEAQLADVVAYVLSLKPAATK